MINKFADANCTPTFVTAATNRPTYRIPREPTRCFLRQTGEFTAGRCINTPSCSYFSRLADYITFTARHAIVHPVAMLIDETTLH